MTHGCMNITEKVLKAILKLAIKSNMRTAQPQRNLVSAVLSYKDSQYWHWLQTSASYIDKANDLWWKHRTPGSRKWMWDDILVYVFGPHWRQRITEEKPL